MQVPEDEKSLIARANRGEKAAIGQLYNTHVQAIYKYVRYRVDTDNVAEDITSEVFLRMVRELPRYSYTGVPFSAWLYRIASNCITDMFRRQRYDVAEELPEELPGDHVDPLDTLAQAENHAQLRQALQLLPSDYQNALILRFVNDMSHAEVAMVMGKSEGALRVLQHRALKALGNTLQTLQRGGGER